MKRYILIFLVLGIGGYLLYRWKFGGSGKVIPFRPLEVVK